MKGRRKVRTDKWRLKEQFIQEARAVLASRPDVGSRFLRLAFQSMSEEPTGVLAGSHRKPV